MEMGARGHPLLSSVLFLAPGGVCFIVLFFFFYVQNISLSLSLSFFLNEMDLHVGY